MKINIKLYNLYSSEIAYLGTSLNLLYDKRARYSQKSTILLLSVSTY